MYRYKIIFIVIVTVLAFLSFISSLGLAKFPNQVLVFMSVGGNLTGLYLAKGNSLPFVYIKVASKCGHLDTVPLSLPPIRMIVSSSGTPQAPGPGGLIPEALREKLPPPGYWDPHT